MIFIIIALRVLLSCLSSSSSSLLLLLLLPVTITPDNSEFTDWLQLHGPLVLGGSEIVCFTTSTELDSWSFADTHRCCSTPDRRLSVLGDDGGNGWGGGDSDVVVVVKKFCFFFLFGLPRDLTGHELRALVVSLNCASTSLHAELSHETCVVLRPRCFEKWLHELVNAAQQASRPSGPKLYIIVFFSIVFSQ